MKTTRSTVVTPNRAEIRAAIWRPAPIFKSLPLLTLAFFARAAHADSADLGAINLFPPSIISSDTKRPPPERTQLDADEAAGVARVAGGRVPPAWRVAERAIRDSFHPPLSAVAVHSAPRALTDQVLLNPPTGPARTRNEPTPNTRGELDLDEQVEATHQAARRPRNWRTVEVEVRLGADGSLESARVTAPSDSAQLDAAALKAVERAVETHPPRDVGDLRVARFRIAAARAVVPLDVAPVSSPVTKSRVRGLVPKLRFHFDEVSGKFEPEKPFSQQLRTDVTLYSLTR